MIKKTPKKRKYPCSKKKKIEKVKKTISRIKKNVVRNSRFYWSNPYFLGTVLFLRVYFIIIAITNNGQYDVF